MRARRRNHRGWRRKPIGTFEQLEERTLLAGGVIELGPSDNIAIDQPRASVELLE
jgi:hypothetical protein